MAEKPIQSVKSVAIDWSKIRGEDDLRLVAYSKLEALNPADYIDPRDYEADVKKLTGYLPLPEQMKAYVDAMTRYSAYTDDERKTNTCQFFDVSEDSEVLPDGSSWKDKISGEQIVTIIDINRNGKPDSGDTGISRDGNYHKDIFISGDIQKFEVLGNFGCAALCDGSNCDLGKSYDVRNVEPDSAEHLTTNLANNTNAYFGGIKKQAGEFADSVTDDPALAGAITVGACLLSLHPYGRAIMTSAGFVMSAAGGATLVSDRIDGIENEIAGRNDAKPMGQHDLGAFLMMFGTPSQKAVTEAAGVISNVGKAVKNVVDSPGIIAVSEPLLATDGAASVSGGGALVMEGGVVAAQNVGVPPLTSMAKFAAEGATAEAIFVPDGSGQRLLKVDDRFKARPGWDSSEAKKASDEVEFFLEMLTEIQGESEEIMTNVDNIRNTLKAIKEIYKKTPDDEVRSLITGLLKEVRADVTTMLDNVGGDSVLAESTAQALSKNLSKKFTKIRSTADSVYSIGKDPVEFMKWERVSEKIVPPDGITVHPAVEKSVTGNPRLREHLERALQDLTVRDSKGNPISNNVKFVWSRSSLRICEVKFNVNGGTRVYFVRGPDGKINVLNIGAKSHQHRDVDTVIARAKELGLGGAVFAIDIDEADDQPQ